MPKKQQYERLLANTAYPDLRYRYGANMEQGPRKRNGHPSVVGVGD